MDNLSEKYYSSSLILSKVASALLQENQGIVINLTEDIPLSQEVSSVVVFKRDNEVRIYKNENDLPDGTLVSITDSEEEEKN